MLSGDKNGSDILIRHGANPQLLVSIDALKSQVAALCIFEETTLANEINIST